MSLDEHPGEVLGKLLGEGLGLGEHLSEFLGELLGEGLGLGEPLSEFLGELPGEGLGAGPVVPVLVDVLALLVLVLVLRVQVVGVYEGLGCGTIWTCARHYCAVVDVGGLCQPWIG